MEGSLDIEKMPDCLGWILCLKGLFGFFFAKVFHQTFITEGVKVLFAACYHRREWAGTYIVSSEPLLGEIFLSRKMY